MGMRRRGDEDKRRDEGIKIRRRGDEEGEKTRIQI